MASMPWDMSTPFIMKRDVRLFPSKKNCRMALNRKKAVARSNGSLST
jgi:hypothetical protein